MTKLACRALFAVVVLIFSSAVSADPVRWYLQGVTLSDGGRAIGSFVFDADTNTYTEIDIATTIGTGLPATSYGDPNPESPGNSNGLLSVPDDSADPLTGQPLVAMEFAQPLSNAGGTTTINTSGFSFEGKCGNNGASDPNECSLIIVSRDFTAGLVTTVKPGAHINAGMNGSWFNPLTPGQGILVDVFPDIPLVFLAWFTFDVTEPPVGLPPATVGDINHRWLTAQGSFRNNEAVLDVFLTTGGLFNDPAMVSVTNPNRYGRIVLTYSDDCRSGLMEFELFEQELSDILPIERIANDNVPLCMELDQE
jgi:hypothetical protein